MSDQDELQRVFVQNKVNGDGFNVDLSPLAAGSGTQGQHLDKCEAYFTILYREICNNEEITNDMRKVLYEFGLKRFPSEALFAINTGVEPKLIREWIATSVPFRDYWDKITEFSKGFWEGSDLVKAHGGDKISAKSVLSAINKTSASFMNIKKKADEVVDARKAEDLIKTASGKRGTSSSGKAAGRKKRKARRTPAK